jgi:two-component system, chemotaxis family, chemotaxis protein CheY
MPIVDRHIRILVVDDYKSMVDMLQDLLSEIGFDNVDEAANGKEALEKLRTESYGLVISDWKMEPVNGLELLQEVRADPELKDLPFLMIAAEAKAERVIAAREAGVNGFMAKPFTRATLEQKVRALAPAV